MITGEDHDQPSVANFWSLIWDVTAACQGVSRNIPKNKNHSITKVISKGNDIKKTRENSHSLFFHWCCYRCDYYRNCTQNRWFDLRFYSFNTRSWVADVFQSELFGYSKLNHCYKELMFTAKTRLKCHNLK